MKVLGFIVVVRSSYVWCVWVIVMMSISVGGVLDFQILVSESLAASRMCIVALRVEGGMFRLGSAGSGDNRIWEPVLLVIAKKNIFPKFVYIRAVPEYVSQCSLLAAPPPVVWGGAPFILC